MKKIIYTLLFICLSMTACQTTSNEDSINITSSAKPVSFHHYFSDSLSGGIEEMVNTYNNTQAVYQLNVVPIDHEAYKASILKAFDNGTPSDMNSYWAGARTESVIEYLTPIDDVFMDNKLDEQFQSSLLKSSSKYNNQYYLMPITQHYVSFYYNKAIFETLNLDEPKDWDSFLEVCARLKDNDITPIGLGAKDKWPAQFWFDYLLLRTSGYDFRQDLLSGKSKYSSDEVKHAMALWYDLIELGYFNEDTTSASWDLDIMAPLMQGDIGMTLMGSWYINLLNSQGYEDQYGVFSFPTIDDSQPYIALGPVDGLIIGKDALNIDGAKDAILQFADPKNQELMAIGSGGFAPNINVPESIYTETQLELLDDMKKTDYWAFNYDLATAPDKASLGLNFFIEFLTFPEAYEYLLNDLDALIDKR